MIINEYIIKFKFIFFINIHLFLFSFFNDFHQIFLYDLINSISFINILKFVKEYLKNKIYEINLIHIILLNSLIFSTFFSWLSELFGRTLLALLWIEVSDLGLINGSDKGVLISFWLPESLVKGSVLSRLKFNLWLSAINLSSRNYFDYILINIYKIYKPIINKLTSSWRSWRPLKW